MAKTGRELSSKKFHKIWGGKGEVGSKAHGNNWDKTSAKTNSPLGRLVLVQGGATREARRILKKMNRTMTLVSLVERDVGRAKKRVRRGLVCGALRTAFRNLRNGKPKGRTSKKIAAKPTNR